MESDTTEVTSQAEEKPPKVPAKDQEPAQNLTQNISNEEKQTVSQPKPTRTRSGQAHLPKSTPISSQKKLNVKEEASPVQCLPEFQDDPSDNDYMPSKCMVTV